MIKKLNFLIDKNNKIKLYVILFFLILSSFLEILGISIIPLMVSTYLENTDTIDILEKSSLFQLINFRNFLNDEKILYFFGVTIFIVFLVKNLLLGLISYFEGRVFKNITEENASKLYNYYLNKNLTFFLNSNPNYLARNIIVENQSIKQVTSMLMYMVKEVFILIGILSILFYANWLITTIIFILITLLALTYILVFKNKLDRLGKSSQNIRGLQLTYLSQAFGAIKDIIIMGKRKFILNIFNKENKIFEYNNMFVTVLSKFPKLIFETFAIIAIFIFIFLISYADIDKNQIIILLSLIAVAIARLMPSYNLIAASVNRIQFIKPSFNLIYQELKKVEQQVNSRTTEEELIFKGEISFKNVSFAYDGQKEYSLKNINEQFQLESIIGITGPSGSGKTTLINLISGFFTPVQGDIFINDKIIHKSKSNWMNSIGYVGQEVYLLDESIKKNIAFGIEDDLIESTKIDYAIKVARLDEYISGLKDGINTIVGDRGIRISGGQKQRIGIARAIYRDPKILILDEATSSLDNKLEVEIITSLISNKKNMTIIMVAHRLTSLKDCDKILYLDHGKLVKTFNSYDELNNQIKDVIL
jgi:ATP-binding cassette, subfamily B, bacterial PglK